jgi:hypothetical protein
MPNRIFNELNHKLKKFNLNYEEIKSLEYKLLALLNKILKTKKIN